MTESECKKLHVLLHRDFHSLCAALLVVFQDEEHYKQLSALLQSSEDIQCFLDLLQEVRYSVLSEAAT